MSRLTSLVQRAVAAAANAAGPVRTRDLSATHAPESATRVAVETKNGAIDVTPADGETLSVEGVARTNRESDDLDAVSIDVAERGDEVRVGAAFPDGRHGISVSLTVRVPDSLAVDRVETKNGAVALTGVRGDASVETKNGAIEVDGVDGTVVADTKNGAVTVVDTPVRTARSKNGRLDLALPGVTGDVSAETKNGSITVRVPDDTDARFELSSGVGSVDTDGVTCLVESESRTHLAGELGAGGPTIDASTKVGSVTLAGR